MGYRNYGFKRVGCRYQNCHTTANRKHLKYDDIDIAAVVVHHDLTENKLLKLANPRLWEGVAKTNFGHSPLFVWFNKEPMVPEDDQLFKDHPDYAKMFNITYTFKQDSDVVLSYGQVMDKSFKHLKDLPQRNTSPKWADPTKHRGRGPKSAFKAKTKDILWMVSNCHASSQREVYVEELKRVTNLTIDILGFCGQDILPSRDSIKKDKTLREEAEANEELFMDKVRDYKFYLSLENAYCTDYVTEKFFSALRSENVIPIVLGGISDEYSRIAPPRSYLNTKDFRSVKDLARKLENLAKNETSYNEYFWWTGIYRVASLMEAFEAAQCKLCQLLNELYQKKVSLKSLDLRQYWNTEKLCNNPPS